MSEQQINVESGVALQVADAPDGVERKGETRISERIFTDDVLAKAGQEGWRTCHFDYRDGGRMVVVRGRGFPDLVMFRENQESGQVEFVVSELKRGPDAQPFQEQQEWLDAFGAVLPKSTYIWRPEDWDEIDRVLTHGPTNARAKSAALSHPTRRRGKGRMPANSMVITTLAETIENIPRGSHAELRRMNHVNPNSATFWELMARDKMPANPDISKWGLIIHGIALMSHNQKSAHNERIPVGRALYEGGGKREPFYSEDRLATLLTARGATLHRLLARLFRMLGNESCAFNWREMTYFILHEGENRDMAEQARIQVARAYYQAKSYHQRRSQDNTSS